MKEFKPQIIKPISLVAACIIIPVMVKMPDLFNLGTQRVNTSEGQTLQVSGSGSEFSSLPDRRKPGGSR